MHLGFPNVRNHKKKISFSNGRYADLPKPFKSDSNENLVDFYRNVLLTSKPEEIQIGVDPYGFTYIQFDFICYVGLVTNKCKRSLYNRLRKKFPENLFDLSFLRKQIQFEHDLLNFKEYIPIDIVTQNLHELRGLNSKISGNVDIIMDIQSEDEWEKKFDEQPETIKKIYVGSRLIKFILDNIKFYQPNFFQNLKMNYDRSFVVHRCVSKIVKIYKNDFKKGLADIELSGTSNTRINGAKEYFEILIKILIENSLKYSEFPKRIGPKVIIQDSRKKLKIEVHSYGRAIPKTERPYLFSKGFRSTVNKQSKEGTGMGLYNAKQLANHFDANILFRCEDISKKKEIDLAWNIFTLSIQK
jgi:signal transduction histidine kinase